MNTKEKLKELETKLENLDGFLELENKRLMDLYEEIIFVSENEDMLDDNTKHEHYNNMVMFIAAVDAYDISVDRYNKYIDMYEALKVIVKGTI